LTQLLEILPKFSTNQNFGGGLATPAPTPKYLQRQSSFLYFWTTPSFVAYSGLQHGCTWKRFLILCTK